MAHAISVTDGTTTINLIASGGNMIEAYTMDTAEDVNDPKITETIDILFVATTGPNLQTAINAVENLLRAAKHRQDKPSSFPKVFLQMQVDGEANSWRAEIIEGRLKPDETVLRLWPNFKAKYALMLTRRAWEGPRKELSISSNGNSAATGGRSITNNANNWIQIASSQVGGVLPTPIELQLTNTTGGSRSYRHFFLATNAFSDPANFSHRLAGGSTTTIADSVSVARVTTALSSTVMGDTQGRTFKPIVRITTLGGPVYCRPELRDTSDLISLTPDTKEKYIPALSTAFIQLDSLALPPGGYQTAWGDTVFGLVFRSAGAYAVTVESTQLTPTDSYQYIAQLGNNIANNGIITFNNIEELYHVGGQMIYSNKSGRLMVWPGVTQRIVILQDEGSSSTTTQTMSVRAFVRERRLTV